ncbi:MAG: 3',5'-cyclic-AMP phosphodiesterase [Gammaproteobacteria bacterium]
MSAPLVLLHVTDTHLHAAADSRMRGVRTYETFLAVLERARRCERWPPAAVLVTGDIVQDESRAGYERFRATLEPLGLPVFCIPGNHDDPNVMSEVLTGGSFHVGGEFRFDGWSLILLSTYLAGEDAGELGDRRLERLDAVLAEHADRHVLIAMHHHPLPLGSRWLDGVGLRDAERFLAVLDKHPHVRAVVCGHVHQVSDLERRGVRFLSTPSTCSQFLPKSEFFALDKLPPGFRWLVLNADGRLETELGWAEGGPSE